MNMIFKECIESTSTDSVLSLSGLIKTLMISESCSVEQLAEFTGLSNTTIKKVLSGNTYDMSVGIFLNIIQVLQCKLNVEKDGETYNIAEYVVPEKLEIKECPECHLLGLVVAAERANSEIKKTIEEKSTFLGTRKTYIESEIRSFHSSLFIPPSPEKYGEKVFKVKIKLYEAMMVCKDCNLLFDNNRKKTAKCDLIGYERMLSTSHIAK